MAKITSKVRASIEDTMVNQINPATEETLQDILTVLGGGTVGHEVWGETPTGTIDGMNLDFTVANTPSTGTLRVYLNGLRQKVGDDYTFTGVTISFITIPDVGSTILVDYKY